LILPPTEPRPEELVLTREPGQDVVLARVPWGDSYLLDYQLLGLYLTQLGCPVVDHLLNLLWNRFALWVGTVEWVIRVVPKTHVDERYGHGEHVFTAAIG
jgi:hypothetical protein